MSEFFKKLFGSFKFKFGSYWFWAVVFLIMYGLAMVFIIHPEKPRQNNPARLFEDGAYSDVFDAMKADPTHSHIRLDVEKESGQQIVYCECGSKSIKSRVPVGHGKDLIEEALALKVAVEVKDDGAGGHIIPEGFPWFPIISIGIGVIFVGIMLFGQRGAGGVSKFLKSEEFKPIKSTTRFADIAGISEARDELQVVVKFFKERKTLEELGGEIPRGILLVGPSGTGKTELARAIAGEADVPFFSVKATRLVEMYVGVGAKRFADQWAQATKNSPCVFFMDEVDAIAAKRGMSAGNNEREVTLNEILISLDGIEGRYPILFIAATNRSELLDDAFKSRMTRTITVPLPNKSGRKEIFRIHLRKIPIVGQHNEQEYETILTRAAEISEGMSGRAIMKVAREQLHVRCMLKYGELRNPMPVELLYEAVEAGLLGDPLLSRLRRPEFRRRVALHEGSHLIVAESLYSYSLAQQKEGLLAPDAYWADPTKLATIIPRSTGSEGVMLAMPEDGDTGNMIPWEAVCGRMMVGQAGNVGEFIGTGTCTNGNAGDNQMCDRLAKMAVLKSAMCVTGPRSLTLPPIFVGVDSGDGSAPAQFYMESQKSHEQIDEAIGAFLWGGRFGADAIIVQRLELLNQIAERLMDEGTIRREEYESLFDEWEVKKPMNHEAWRKYFQPNGKKTSEIELRKSYLFKGGEVKQLETPLPAVLTCKSDRCLRADAGR